MTPADGSKTKKELIEELEESRRAQDWFRDFVEESPGLICRFKADGVLTYVNKTYCNYFEKKQEDLVGQKFTPLIPHDDLPVLKRMMMCLSPGMKPYTTVHRVVLPSGELRWNRWINSPSTAAGTGGEPEYQAIGEDITGLKRAELALCESERKYRLMTEHSSDYISVLTLTGIYKYVSPSHRRLGYKPADLVGKSALDMMHPEDRERVLPIAMRLLNTSPRTLARIFKMERALSLTFRFPDKSGRWMFIESTSNLIENIDGIGYDILVISRDVTMQKRVETELKRSEERYRTLFKAANDAIFLLEGNKIIKCNDQTLSVFGCDSEMDMVGSTMTTFSSKVQPDGKSSREEIKKRLSAALKGTPQRFYWRYKQKNGGSFEGEVSLNRVKFGGKYFVQAMVRDITEQKKLQDQLYQAQKMESVGALAGGIAHDFNNILTAINGYAELALMKSKQDSKLKKPLRNILESGQRAVTLVGKLLAFSRKQIIRPRVIDINETIHNLARMVRRIIGEDINIEYILKPGASPIKADLSQIEQILLNLMVNARDAIADKNEPEAAKKITVETGNVTLDEKFIITNPGSRPGAHVMIAVTDNGTGMDEDTQAKIFEPFFTTKSAGKGTGLGLATVYGIVKQNNGSIYVDSKKNRRTTFRIYWPVATEKIAPPKKLEEQIEVQGGSEMLLFVEDDRAVRDFTTNALRELGYRVLEAHNGIEALRIVETEKPDIDLVITDVIMPEMGGKELAEHLKRFMPDLKVLFTSGYTVSHIVHSGVVDQDVDFIQKPYSIQSLAKKVRAIILRNGATPDNPGNTS